MQLNASLQRFKGRGGEKKITVKYRFRFHGGEKMLSHFKSFNMYLFIVTPQTVPEIKRIKSETKCKQSRRLKKKKSYCCIWAFFPLAAHFQTETKSHLIFFFLIVDLLLLINVLNEDAWSSLALIIQNQSGEKINK